MNKSSLSFSRREFARRAALGTAAVASGEWRAAGGKIRAETTVASAQLPPEASKLSPQSAAEAEARYQAILQQYGERFSEAQKTDLRRLCVLAQEPLDRLRAFRIENGDQPDLFLKPLVEREKKNADAATGKAVRSNPEKSLAAGKA